jgi:hypothetical protein
MATAATSADASTLYAAIFDVKHRKLKFDLRSGDPQSITVTHTDHYHHTTTRAMFVAPASREYGVPIACHCDVRASHNLSCV